jgi:hypothetical protein
MAQLTLPHDVPPIVERKLAQVRRGIRAYVWLEGLAAVAITLAIAFWGGLLFDWLFEPRPAVRLAATVAVAMLAIWVLYRSLLRRAFVRLPNASLAVLLERRFSQLKDHLLTAVDMATGDGEAATYHPELVARTHQAAAAATATLDARKLFRRGPLLGRVLAALVLAASIPIFAFAARDAYSFWLQRLALSPELWPRRVHLEVVGFPPDAEGRRTHKMARDDDFELVVHANTENFVAPAEVQIRSLSADGGRGRDTMIRVGDAVPGRDAFQLFRYEFHDVADDLTLDVLGGDDRVEDLQLEIVERPELVNMQIECVYPEYLGRPARRIPVTGGMRIPEGTKLTLDATSTKPLTQARIGDSRTQQVFTLNDSQGQLDQLRWEYGELKADDVVSIHVTDTDGVTCREPYRVSLSVIPDELPQVNVRLAGIGTAITPNATIPMAGKVSDDYGLERIWCAYQVNDGPSRERLLTRQPGGKQEESTLGAFDTRGADSPSGPRAIELKPGQTLFLSLRATDRYDLTDAPRVGTSQQFALDVVTVPQLLALLERRELELRQRFESVFAKMTDTRNLLGRVDFNDAEVAPAEDQSDDATATPESAAERALARRRLRVAGALQNVTQSAHEVQGLAEAFDDVHDQLQNNRVDNPDLMARVTEHIAQPLHQLGERSMTQLESQLQLVNEQVADATAGPPALADSRRLADQVLVEMQQVLDHMLELESYNEVVGLLRDIIDDQKTLNDRTKRQQNERLQDLLDE